MPPVEFPTPLVSPIWLAAHLGDPDLVILDASMKPVGSVGAAPAAPDAWLPKARIFDFDTRVCDRKSALPHMMPTPEVFEQEVRALGVNAQSQIVVYDKVGIFSSPRAWWMLK